MQSTHSPRWIAAALLSLASLAPAPAPGQTQSGTLGIYFDPAGTVCSGTIRPDTPGTIHILARLEGTSAAGIAGAEFRIGGIPETWETYPVPNPTMFSLGDPFANGVVGTFTKCQSPENGIVSFYTVLVLASALEENLQFTLSMRNPPSNPGFACPLVLLCDAPAYSQTCVEAQPCFVNPTAARTCNRPTPVDDRTWSQVKGLYRR